MAETRFHTLLKARILEQVEKEKNYVSSGGPPDYARYQFSCGRIVALDDVLKICEDIEREFD